MKLFERTETTFIVRNSTLRNDILLGGLLIVLGIIALASISYVIEYTTLTCSPVANRSVTCLIEEHRLSGVYTTELTNVLAVYVTEATTIGTGRFQVRRDQIVLVADQGEVIVPYFYSAEFGKVQVLATRIARYLENPQGRTLSLRQNQQVEHEFLNVVAGAVLIAIGHAQIALQVRRWEFDRSDGPLVMIKQRIMGQQVMPETPCAVRIERTSDYRILRDHEHRRSWVTVVFPSGSVQRITHSYKDSQPEYPQLEPLVHDLRQFLGVGPV